MGGEFDRIVPWLEAVARAFETIPSGRPLNRVAERAYAAFRREVVRQFEGLPVVALPWEAEGQPYANSQELFTDLEENGRLFVFTGGEEHPYLSRDETVKFRAVHDYYGHFLGRFQFGPRGEFRAWKAHCVMFSEEARPALTAETLGQSCWVNFGPFRHLPPSQRPYAEQKAGLLPPELWRPLLEDNLAPPERTVR